MAEDIPTLGISEEDRREELHFEDDPDFPKVCRMCEDNLRIPGQFLCEACAYGEWGEDKLEEVLSKTRTVRGL